MSKIYLQFIATLFVIYGLAFMLFPVELLQLVVQGRINSSSGWIDIRATYGGLTVAVGVILLLLSKDKSTLRIGLISVFVLMAGMAFGRITGIVLDGQPNFVMYLYLISEILGSLLAAVFLRKLKED